MRVLGFDPGDVNFAWATYDDKPLDYGYVITNDVGESNLHFLNSIVDIIHKTKPDCIVIERYMFRGAQSVHAEPVNQMIGQVMLLAQLKRVPIVQITAAQWKIKLKTKSYTNGARGLFPDTKFHSVHQADACGMAMYHYDRLTEVKPAKKVKKAASKSQPSGD